MSQNVRTCPQCGGPLPADVPAGIEVCPSCMLAAALEAPSIGPIDVGGEAAEVTLPIPERQENEPLPFISSRYCLLQILGEGGMGVVYKAEQCSPVHRTVAIKLIKLGMDTKQVIARFESERQALAVLNHPHVAAVYDAGATDRPAISSKGPSTPPVRMIASSQGHSSRRTGASRVIRKVRRTSITTNRPRPEPRYSNPARSVGAMSRWSAF